MNYPVICFTGHRPDKLGGYIEPNPIADRIKNILQVAIRATIYTHKTKTFISGMAQGVDTWAAEIVLKFRAAGAPVKLVCATPFPGQERRWSAEAQDHYRRILDQADEVKILFPHLKPRAALLARNRWMVDHSDAVIAVWNGSPGGTKNTVDYAVKTKKTVFVFW